MEFHATHHHTLKLGIELLKLGGEFLPGKTEDLSVALYQRWNTPDQDIDETKFTSHVWLSLLTAGLLIPIMMAKNEFKFLNSRQLRTNAHKQDIRLNAT